MIAHYAPAQIYYVPPVDGVVVRHYEPPPTRYSAGHRGLDIAANKGTVVVAAAPGRIAFAGKIANQWYVSIDHADGIRTTYDYLASVLVKKNQDVSQRDPVGKSGAGHPGSNEAPHMMFGMRRGKEYLDPEPYLIAGFRHDYSRYVRLSEPPQPWQSPNPLPSRVPGPLFSAFPSVDPSLVDSFSLRGPARSTLDSKLGSGLLSFKSGRSGARIDGETGERWGVWARDGPHLRQSASPPALIPLCSPRIGGNSHARI